MKYCQIQRHSSETKSGGNNIPDIRERVESDRGLLKKIQLHIPGYAGYRRREDIRAADNLLRIQINEKMKLFRDGLETARETAAQSSPKISLSNLGNVIFELEGAEARVRHAEQGYSGFSPAIRIEEEELDRLYEYDYAMLQGLANASSDLTALQSAVDGNDKAAFEAAVRKLRADLKMFDDAFKQRTAVISGTAVS